MAKGDHVADADHNKAVLDYDGKYRQTGYLDIKGNVGRRKIYDDVVRIQSVLTKMGTRPRIPSITPGGPDHAQQYIFIHVATIKGKARTNFLDFGPPYPSEAHHLVPESVFNEGNFLTPEQLVVMRKADYDVNNGKNIMFLPQRKKDAPIHNLPIHRGSHKKYTDAVKKDADAISDGLQKAVKKDQPHETWNPPADIVEKLYKLQDDYWNLLKNAGMIKVSDFEKPATQKKVFRR